MSCVILIIFGVMIDVYGKYYVSGKKEAPKKKKEKDPETEDADAEAKKLIV